MHRRRLRLVGGDAGGVREGGAVRAGGGGEGGGDGEDGAPGVQHRRRAVRRACPDKGGGVCEEQWPGEGLSPRRPAGVRHCRPVERRQVFAHQHACSEEGNRPHL